MKRLYFKKTLVAATFAQITKDFSSRSDLFIIEAYVKFAAIPAANIAVDEQFGFQLGSKSNAAIVDIDINTPIVKTKDAVSVIGILDTSIEVKPKKSIKISLNDDGKLYIGLICPDAVVVSGWIAYSEHETPDMRKYLK